MTNLGVIKSETLENPRGESALHFPPDTKDSFIPSGIRSCFFLKPCGQEEFTSRILRLVIQTWLYKHVGT